MYSTLSTQIDTRHQYSTRVSNDSKSKISKVSNNLA